MEAPRGAGATLQGVAPARVVAALFVAKRGCYFGLPDVDPWDETRDARSYAGPWPVVAHPPCATWGAYARLGWTKKPLGEDGGCFAAALAAVRRWGGVLEHPAESSAWDRFDLTRPARHDGWQRDIFGAWTCYVEQAHYGHRARKPTWLYAVAPHVPAIIRGKSIATARPDSSKTHNRPELQAYNRMGARERAATPPRFRDLLLEIARGCR